MDRLREKNIFWTLLGDYTKKAPDFAMPKFRELKEGSDLFENDWSIRQDGVFAAMAHEFLDLDKVRDFFNLAAKKKNSGLFVALFYMCADSFLEAKTFGKNESIYKKDAIAYIRKNYFEHMVKLEHNYRVPPPEFALLALYFKHKLKKANLGGAWERSVLKEVESSQEFLNTVDLLEHVNAVASKYFELDNWPTKLFFKDSNYSDTAVESAARLPVMEDEDHITKTNKKKKTDIQDLEPAFVELVLDAEFNQDRQEELHTDEYKEKRSDYKRKTSSFSENQNYSLMVSNYGLSSVRTGDLELIEKRICVGEHANCKLHITDGVMPKSSESQQLSLERQRQKNKAAYDASRVENEIEIKKLTSALRDLIDPDSNIEYVSSNNGKLCASRAWRAARLDDNAVFTKRQKDKNDTLSVDLFIDASGSQIERQGKLAIQAYILACAFTALGLKCCVSSFMSFMDYTVLRTYKDYDEGIDTCDNIFDFAASGMNRDGLAYRYIADKLSKRREEHKVLIVLNDGKPYDKIIKSAIAAKNSRTNYYGERAIKNSAAEVHACRTLGIKTLGVFNGKPEDLRTQKRIFGKDFASTRDLGAFSNIAIRYLTSVL